MIQKLDRPHDLAVCGHALPLRHSITCSCIMEESTDNFTVISGQPASWATYSGP